MKKESFIYSTLTIGGSKEQVNEVMKYICDDIYDIGSIDLNKICAVPVHLNIGPDDEVSCGEKLYRHYLDLVPYPTEEEEENFLAVLSRADQRRFLLGKMAVLNRKEYGYPTYTGWCTEHWGTDENVISFEECNENSIAFLTHSAPASEAIHTLSIATVYKGNIIKNLIMDCQSYTKYRPNETTGGIFVSWRRKEELPTGA